MNTEAILRVAKTLDQLIPIEGLYFEMKNGSLTDTHNPRGYAVFDEAGGIDKWTVAVLNPLLWDEMLSGWSDESPALAASQIFGVDPFICQFLFFPNLHPLLEKRILKSNSKQAAEVLRHFANTGEVNWKRVLGWRWWWLRFLQS